MSTKKHTARVTILNEEFTIRSDTPPEHTKAVAQYLDQAIRKIMSSGAVVESNRAVVLAALQITAELFDARASAAATAQSIQELSDYVRPLLPPSKRN
jgi:cell division protein ZapA